MAKAGFVPKHYSLTMHPSEMLDLIVTLRAVEREGFALSREMQEFRATCEAAYQGDLPEPPGEPIHEDAPVNPTDST